MIGLIGTLRFVQCVQFCTVWTFWNWLVLKGPTGCTVCTVCTVLCSLKLIGNKGTNSIVSDLVNILKMIGLEGTLSVYSLYCVAYPTVLSVWIIYKTQTSRDSKTFLSATRGFPTLLFLNLLTCCNKICQFIPKLVN